MSYKESSPSSDALIALCAAAFCIAILLLSWPQSVAAQEPPSIGGTLPGDLEERANEAFGEDELDTAINLYRQLAGRLEGTEKVRILLTLAWVEHLTGSDTEAQETLIDALALEPTTPFRAELYDEGFSDLFFEAQKRASEKRAFLINQSARKGIERLRAGDNTEARRHFEQVLKLRGDHPEAIYNLALVDLRDQRNDDALDGFQKLATLAETQPGSVSAPVRALALTNLGYLYNLRQSSTEAEQVLERAVTYDAKIHSAWSNLGIARRRLGKTQAAAEAFAKAYALKPDDGRVMNNLGLSYIDLKDWMQAVAILKKATDLHADDPSLWLNFGLAQMGMKNVEGALSSFGMAIEKDPSNARGWASAGALQLAGHYYQTGDHAATLAEAKRIIAWHPHRSDGWSYQGLAQKALGDLTAARTSFEEARRLKPGSAPGHNNLGSVYFELKRLAEAKESFEQALRIDAGFVEAQRNLAAVNEMLSRPPTPTTPQTTRRSPPPPTRRSPPPPTRRATSPPPRSPSTAPISKASIGLRFSDTDYSALGIKGIMIEAVTAGSAAARAGLEPRDLILKVAGHDVGNADEFYRLISEAGKQVVRLDLLRANMSQKIDLRVR
jgi:tetratricopeptide (TPR) repeat protein